MSNTVLRQLRALNDPEMRLKASQALAEAGDVQAAPWLIRAVVEDPDPAVRAAAQSALLDLIGGETDLAIQTYRADPDEDEWLVDGQVEEGEEDAGGSTYEDDQYLMGLVTVLRNHADPHMRLKAIREIGGNSDMRVIAALAETVLWTDDRDVRQAARAALEQRFGEETDAIIQSYQVLDEADDEDEDYADADQGDEAGSNQDEAHAHNLQSGLSGYQVASPQAVREEEIPWVLVLIVGVGIMALVVVLLLLVRAS